MQPLYTRIATDLMARAIVNDAACFSSSQTQVIWTFLHGKLLRIRWRMHLPFSFARLDESSSRRYSGVEGRFKTVTNEEIEKFFDSRQAKSTKRNTAWGFFKIGTWRSMVLY
uniref:Uncharacterized protein n=1 Tax=Magallana gigas TaxID=29159 RepID=A0A8W8MET8_MAGGI